MKLVIDTSILIAYALKNEQAIRIIELIEEGLHTMYVSPLLVYEYKNVLRLNKFKFSKEYQLEVLEKVNKLAEKVSPDIYTKFSRDKYDSHLLSLANYIQADLLISDDKTLQKANHLTTSKIVAMNNLIL